MSSRHGEAPRAVDKPEPGFFVMRLVKGGPWVPARILHEDGLFSAIIGGEPQGEPNADPFLARGVSRVWEGGRAIEEDEYRYQLTVSAWAKSQRPDHPAANPTKPIDLKRMPSIF